MMPSRRTSHGFTLTEVLVVLAIVGFLLAFLIPAVMQATAAARRTACQNHLRQLGIALHSYNTAHRWFPAGTENEWSWQARLLPYFEEANLSRGMDFAVEPFEDPNHSSTATLVPVLLCPADPQSNLIHEPAEVPGFRFAHTNYLGSLDAKERLRHGMFGEYHRVRMAQVQDGASRTLFVGERPVITADGKSYGWWVWGPETLISATHGLRPGSSDDAASADHWWSTHSDGAHFLFVDGSVQLLAYSIDPTVFAGLGTRDGGEVIADF
jgi:prepilin-type N-terminal cleavage/methylation domain-containing protein/prepilin-type processing-associated H-X9-DG protein